MNGPACVPANCRRRFQTVTPSLSISRWLHVDRSATARLVAWSIVAISQARTRRRRSSGTHRGIDHRRRSRHMRRGMPAVPGRPLPIELLQIPLHESVCTGLELGAAQTRLLPLELPSERQPLLVQLDGCRCRWQRGRRPRSPPPRSYDAPRADASLTYIENCVHAAGLPGGERRGGHRCTGSRRTASAVPLGRSADPVLAHPADTSTRDVTGPAHRSASCSARTGSAASSSSPSRGP